MTTTQDKAQLLRRALRANGTFSIMSGIAFILAARPIANLIGIDYPVVIAGIGLSLAFFAVALFFNAARSEVSRIEAALAVAGDLAWVAGSGVVIALGILTTSGNWAVALIADIVLLFAIFQFVGLRRLTRIPS